jgi:hypothetical protein
MARDPPPKYVLYGMIGVAIVAIIAILVVFIMSNRAPTNVPNGGTCTSDKQCLSKYCNKTDPVNPVCDVPPCIASGKPCDPNVQCCGVCGSDNNCTDPPVSWIPVPGYNVSSSQDVFGKRDAQVPECQTLCDNDCAAFAYFNTQGGCNFSQTSTDPTFNKDITSYIKKTVKQPLTLPGVYVGDTPYRYTGGETQSSCSDRCTKMDGCVAYTYDSGGTGSCTVAKDLKTIIADSSYTNLTTYIL